MECIRINFTKTHVNPFLAQCSITKPSANVKKPTFGLLTFSGGI